MPDATTTFATVAAELAAAFQTRIRTDGTAFILFGDNVPRWIYSADMSSHVVMNAHDAAGYSGPADWVWDRCRRAADAFAEWTDGDAAADGLQDWCGGSADVYTADLLAWAATASGQALADEAADDYGATPTDAGPFSSAVIAWAQRGQILAAERIGAVLLAAIVAEAARRDAAA